MDEDGGATSQLDLFRADLEKYYRLHFGSSSPPLRKRAALWVSHLGLHCVAAHRLARQARSTAARRRWAAPALLGLARVVEHGMELVHHVRISAEVGPGFYIGHAGMIFIGPTRIGRNFSVTHGVTIGVGQAVGAKGTPVVGDDVWVGTGSVLAGAIEVGDGATVVTGSVVTRAVPRSALVAGNPARVVMLGYDNADLLGGSGSTRWRGAPAPEPAAPPAVEQAGRRGVG
ncbi:MAG: hypothetical protein QM767_29325 [Anaeromyxobacter sp.]